MKRGGLRGHRFAAVDVWLPGLRANREFAQGGAGEHAR
jgi:hypothetical protein